MNKTSISADVGVETMLQTVQDTDKNSTMTIRKPACYEVEKIQNLLKKNRLISHLGNAILMFLYLEKWLTKKNIYWQTYRHHEILHDEKSMLIQVIKNFNKFGFNPQQFLLNSKRLVKAPDWFFLWCLFWYLAGQIINSYFPQDEILHIRAILIFGENDRLHIHSDTISII